MTWSDFHFQRLPFEDGPLGARVEAGGGRVGPEVQGERWWWLGLGHGSDDRKKRPD